MPISKIGSKALVDCSVAAVDIADNSITAAKLAGSIANAKLANSSVTINSTSVSLGASVNINALDWQSVIVADGSTGTTGVAGRGYFINTTSAAHIFTLPVSATRGDTIAIKDYAGTFATFNLTIARNGHNIQGVANNSLISTNRASVVLVYADVTRGWEYVTESNVAVLVPVFITATGGTITTSGDFKIHTFTGDGSFVVSQLGNTLIPSAARDTVDYLVVAGGGGGAARHGGGGGAGGFRESKDSTLNSPHTASPLAATTGITITATSYPITVGAGGAGATSSPANGPPVNPGQAGSNSIFSTITSAGGGSSGGPAPNGQGPGKPGGSGGGGSWTSGTSAPGGTGNSPPVSPSQGNPGGTYTTENNYIGSGGGGATAAGGGTPNNVGGAGATTSISGSPTSYAGGGGGGNYSNGTPDPAAPGAGGLGGGGQGSRGSNQSPTARVASGTINTGGGGGGGGAECSAPTFIQENGGSGGSGIVVIRYKFQ